MTQGNVTQDFSTLQSFYDNNQIEAFINRLDLLLTHGDMRQATKDTILDLVTTLKGTTHGNDRLKLAMLIEMVIISPEYNILR